MDRYAGPAALEWWANRWTCLGRFDAHVLIDALPDGWCCVAAPVRSWTEAEREGFDFLMSLDPVFDLRFTDDSTLPVQVVEPYDVNRLTLIEGEPVRRSRPCTAGPSWA